MAKFFLMRHCEAETGEQLDTQRGLTGTGKEQRKVVADFLKTQTDKIGAVLCSSDLKRGIETGEWLADKLGVELLQSPYVDPPNNAGTVSPDDIQNCWTAIEEAAQSVDEDEELLVVGHGPMINALTADLLDSGDGVNFHFSHGSLMRLEVPDDGPNMLHWFASVKMMLRAMKQDRDAEIDEALALVDSMLSDLGVQFDPVPVEEARGGSYTYEETLLKRVIEGASASGPCEDCDENVAAGWIDSEDVYPTGDDGPEFHPNCVCDEEYKISRKRVYD